MYPDPDNEMDGSKKSQDAQGQAEVELEVEKQAAEPAATSADATPLPEEVTPGKYLLTAREKSGLNRARVGQALGLTEKAIKNLETDGFDLFPGSVYVRGYLKNYARLLGSDQDELIAIYDRYCADHHLSNGRSTADLTSMPASQGNNRKVITVVIAILVVVLAFIVVSSFT